MMIQDYQFTADVNPEIRRELLQLMEGATSLDEVFDRWFLEKGHQFGVGISVDDDGTSDPDAVTLCFDTKDGGEVCTATISRSEIIKSYPDTVSFDSFVKGWTNGTSHLELDEKKFEEWMKKLGFKESYALMGNIGPRQAVVPLMLSFALSKGGIVEARHFDCNDYLDCDDLNDLDEEEINLDDYFQLYAAYAKDPESRSSVKSIFHPFYCRKRV